MISSNQIKEYILDVQDPLKSFYLGYQYELDGQLAAGVSFYLKCVELSQNKNLTYEALLRVANILNSLEQRVISARSVYNNAISLMPNRPEAYFLLSRHYEKLKEWLDAYTQANLGDFYKEIKIPTLTDIGYPGEYGSCFQMAVTAWWIGLYDFSYKLFYKLADDYGEKLNKEYKNSVLYNINFLKLYNHPHLKYDISKYSFLKYKFPGSEKIKENYSQTYQDIFVLTCLNGKKKGTYIEIGAGDAFYGSNTALLDLHFEWKGISVEKEKKYSQDFLKNRSAVFINEDALNINYKKIFENNNLPLDIDYLQLDCEPSEVTYNILQKIPFDPYRYAVITFEHDYYVSNSIYKKLSRDFLISKGYEMIFDDVAPDRLCSYEDWWVHPKLVDRNIIDKIKQVDGIAKKASDLFLIN